MMTGKELFISNLKSFFLYFNPYFWIPNYKTSNKQTSYIDEIIKNDLAESCDGFRLKIKDGKSIWVENYPYSYGCDYEFGMLENSQRLPNIETRIRLKKYVKEKFGYDATKS